MGKKNSLSIFYESLPEASYPKTEFVTKVANACNVHIATARNWVLGNTKPVDSAHVKVLSEMTGIPAGELWNK